MRRQHENDGQQAWPQARPPGSATERPLVKQTEFEQLRRAALSLIPELDARSVQSRVLK